MTDTTTAIAKPRSTFSETPLGWLRTEIDRLFDDFGRPTRAMFDFGRTTLAPVPAVELTEEDKAYRLTAELPGMKEDEVDISVDEGSLLLSGEKREESERKEGGALISERRYGAFERRIPLPSDVDPDKIKAEFKKGVLTITLAKDTQAAERRRKIAITNGD